MGKSELGRDMWYETRGYGPLRVLLLHGLGCTGSRDYASAQSFLKPDLFTQLVVDLPGFGRSTAPEGFTYDLEEHAACVESLVDHVGFEETSIIGHSLGGTIATLLLTRARISIDRLVLIEPFLAHYPGKPYQELRRTPLRSRIGQVLYMIGGANHDQRRDELAFVRDAGIPSVIIDEAGHDLLYTHSDEVYAVIAEYLLSQRI